MKEKKLCKGLAFAIILMFVGLGFVPDIHGSVIKSVNFDGVQNYGFVSGELIIKLAKDATISSSPIEVLNEKHQMISIEKVFKNSENSILDNIYLLSVPEDTDILSIVDDYFSCLDIEYAEPNSIFYFAGIPNDENFSNQWALCNTGQASGSPGIDIDALEAWGIETGDENVVIAVIDSGVDYTHPDLANNIWVNDDEIPGNNIDDDGNDFIDDVVGWDFVGESPLFPNPDNDPLDDNGHGTHCAGIISAVTNNNIGVAGVCWSCKIMPVKVGGGSLGLVNLVVAVKGIEYAVDNGADVISMSFGSYDFSETLDYVLNYAHEQGVVVVASAGNGNTYQKSYPAAYDKVIAVAATDINDGRAEFSNYGNWIDVAAPGCEIFSTMPTYNVAMNNLGYNRNYDYCDGTSMSCPIVVGLAALLLSYDPNLTTDEVRSIIHYSTDWADTDRYIGNGRVNAHKALLIVAGITVPPNKPNTPSGPANGKTRTEYTYSVSTTDLDGDDLYYLIDWDDGTYSGWKGPFASGTTGLAAHKWNNQGKYQIKVKARDTYGVESEWSNSLLVTIQGNSKIVNGLFLQSHPHMFPILQLLLQRLRL